MNTSISIKTLQRLPLYYHYLKALEESDPTATTSATIIADQLGLNQVQVRKDLAAISGSGRPKVGYHTKELLKELETFLGYNNTNNAVIVGAGKLGRALMGYEGFKNYGLNILAAFDQDPAMAGEVVSGKTVFSIDQLETLCLRLQAHIGILTVPAGCAQEICDRLVAGNVLAIWNFAPTHLVVPEGILVQNENMASSLAMLSNHLAETLRNE